MLQACSQGIDLKADRDFGEGQLTMKNPVKAALWLGLNRTPNTNTFPDSLGRLLSRLAQVRPQAPALALALAQALARVLAPGPALVLTLAAHQANS